YVAASPSMELGTIERIVLKDGILVVEADKFGLKGTVLEQVGASEDAVELAAVLRKGLSRHKPPDKSFASHVRDGHRAGIFWETLLPVTDPLEKRAREEGRSAK